jgi:hypothetical protein
MDGQVSVVTVLLSIATSSAVAAVLSSLLAGRNERRKQLRERKMLLAGDFAGDAMDALARLRLYRPTKGPGDRNEALHENSKLQRERAESVRSAIDRLRPLRGRVWVAFPGRTGDRRPPANGSETTADRAEEVVQSETTADRAKKVADWADEVVHMLRLLDDISSDFWTQCALHPEARARLEAKAGIAYSTRRNEAWVAIERFADSAALQLAQ